MGRQLMNRIEESFLKTPRFKLFTGSKSGKNPAFYKKLRYCIVRYEKLNEVIEFVYLEKNRDPYSRLDFSSGAISD